MLASTTEGGPHAEGPNSAEVLTLLTVLAAMALGTPSTAAAGDCKKKLKPNSDKPLCEPSPPPEPPPIG